MKRISMFPYGLIIFMMTFSIDVFAQSVKLDIPYFVQGKESPWAEEKLGNKSIITIRTHGCALTCISMVFSHFSEELQSPSTVNKWLQVQNGYRNGWEGDLYLGEVNIHWPTLASFDKGYIYTRHDWKVKAADTVLIEYYLDKQIPVIAEVLYKGAPHYVVLTGYDNEGFFMHDPEFPDINRLNDVYKISDKWGSGPSRNIYGIRVLYPSSSS